MTLPSGVHGDFAEVVAVFGIKGRISSFHVGDEYGDRLVRRASDEALLPFPLQGLASAAVLGHQ
jgi:hypothetical protein